MDNQKQGLHQQQVQIQQESIHLWNFVHNISKQTVLIPTPKCDSDQCCTHEVWKAHIVIHLRQYIKLQCATIHVWFDIWYFYFMIATHPSIDVASKTVITDQSKGCIAAFKSSFSKAFHLHCSQKHVLILLSSRAQLSGCSTSQ
jgi:hypothetical protein